VSHTVIDEIAERFLDMVDGFDESIDELEDHVQDWPSTTIRARISSVRHDILHVRRVLAPTRDAARAVLDDRVEIDGDVSLFPRDIELRFADAYDKLLRATDDSTSPRPARRRARLPPGRGRERPERGDERLTVVAPSCWLPTFDRRDLRPELLHTSPSPLGLRVRLVVGIDSSSRASCSSGTPPQTLDLTGGSS